MSAELSSRTDYESDSYAALIEKMTSLSDRIAIEESEKCKAKYLIICQAKSTPARISAMSSVSYPPLPRLLSAAMYTSTVRDGVKMNISTLADILSKGPRFDYIYFDCCYMSSIETAYELRTVTDIIVDNGLRRSR